MGNKAHLVQKDTTMKNATVTLIDVENAHGASTHSPASVRGLKAQLELLLGGHCGHTVIATSFGPSLFDVKAGWGDDATYRVREAKDGAEDALIEYLRKHYPAGSVDELIVVSGDHRFTDLVAEHRRHGAVITVVSPYQACAETLRRVAHHVKWLPEASRFQTVLAS